MEQTQKCKKIVFAQDFNSDGLPIKTKALKGIIVDDDIDFVTFRTAYRDHKINRKYVISISDTTDIFVESIEDERI